MAIPSYFKQIGQDKIALNLEEVPDKAFIDAVMVRDIYKMKIIGRRKKIGLKPGEPDVEMCDSYGNKHYITRQELCDVYRHSSGKKIIMAFMKNDKSYIVQRCCRTDFKVMKLPDNCIGITKNRKIQPGNFIVCKTNESGEINRGTMRVINPKNFRKMFKVPMQEIFNRPEGGDKRFTLLQRYSDKSIASGDNVISSNISMGNLDMSKKLNIRNLNTDTQNKNDNPDKTGKENETKYKYRATYRLVSMDNEKLIAFMIQDIESGKEKQLGLQQVAQLCKVKSVENLKLVSRENGTQFLQGNGIKIDSIPKLLL